MRGKCLFIVVRFGQAFGLIYMRSAILDSHTVGVTANALAVHVQSGGGKK